MSHPLIISQGSVWAQSRLCAEAEAERAERERPIIAAQRRLRARNAREWEKHHCFAGKRGDHGNPATEKKAPPVNRPRTSSSLEKQVLAMIARSDHPLCWQHVTKFFPDKSTFSIAAALRALDSAGLVRRTRGPNPFPSKFVPSVWLYSLADS